MDGSGRPSSPNLLVQGMRTVAPTKPRNDWRWVIARRLRREHNLLASGTKTAEAEHGLQLQPCSYFYVGRCEPEFSDYAIAYEDVDTFESGTAPFDSGGLWFGHIATKTTAGREAELRSLLERHTMPHDAYGILFQGWVAANYAKAQDYVEGLQPTCCFAPEIELTPSSDARSWTWEMRVEKSLFPDVPLKPSALCISRPKMQQLTQWVIGEGDFAPTERASLLSTIQTLHFDPDGAGSGYAMNNWLKGSA